MEGRDEEKGYGLDRLAPQWRAGINPGRTHCPGSQSVASVRPQWRAGINPGRTAEAISTRSCTVVPQWRAGINPGRTGDALMDVLALRVPQWRAGINPGRTRPRRAGTGRNGRAAMEGRVLVRFVVGHRGRNGGPGLIPAELPGPRHTTACCCRRNGGPGLIPAEPERSGHWFKCARRPQWRAGINPGRTLYARRRNPDGTVAAMEGRD